MRQVNYPANVPCEFWPDREDPGKLYCAVKAAPSPAQELLFLHSQLFLGKEVHCPIIFLSGYHAFHLLLNVNNNLILLIGLVFLFDRDF